MGSNSLYGIIDCTGRYTDVSPTLLGAKMYATRHKYKMVGRRNTDHYYIIPVAVKVNNKWEEFHPIEHANFLEGFN